MAALLLLALLVRWLPAFIPHFWYNEMYTIAIIQSPLREITRVTAQDAHPPLYYFWVKCFAALGRRLGGPFATLAWLRLASILPGLLTCLLAWAAARRAWSRGRALWVLALFALSPALAYYSVELRQYSSTHFLLLAGMLGLLLGLDPRQRRPAPVLALFTLSMIVGLYVHNLTVLHLGAMGLICLAEWLLCPAERRLLLRRGAAAALPVALCYLPWVSNLPGQARLVNQCAVDWIPWARWRDLPLTFFWHMPLGVEVPDFQNKTWPRVVVILIGLGLAALVAAALSRKMRKCGPGITPACETPDPGSTGGRLMAYSAALTVFPILAAFVISHGHVARIFLSNHYNLMAVPFFNFVLLGLIFGLRRRWLRTGLLCAILGVSAFCSARQLRQRFDLNDIALWARTQEPGIRKPDSRLYWINPLALPWLGRAGPFTLTAAPTALPDGQPDPATGDCYYFVNFAFGKTMASTSCEAILLQTLVARRGTACVDLTGHADWDGVWRLSARDEPALLADLKKARQAIEARRRSIPDGQMLLADDPAFHAGRGWSCLEVSADLMPLRWTQGPRQMLAWAGPEKPGRYHLTMTFWRAHPYPQKEITLRWRLGSQAAAQTQSTGVGPVVIEGDVIVERPRQALNLELETPTWIPAEHLAGSNDPRPLGMILVALELRPSPH